MRGTSNEQIDSKYPKLIIYLLLLFHLFSSKFYEMKWKKEEEKKFIFRREMKWNEKSNKMITQVIYICNFCFRIWNIKLLISRFCVCRLLIFFFFHNRFIIIIVFENTTKKQKQNNKCSSLTKINHYIWNMKSNIKLIEKKK